jgi:uncharacterized protein DUF6023
VLSDRAAGAILYAFALLLLLAGGGWFVRAAPELGEDPVVVAGRATVERLLPDVPQQSQSETLVLTEGVSTDRSTTEGGGSYALTMLCVGAGQVRVRLSSVGEDSGRAVPCAARNPQSVELTVALADDLHLAVAAETRGTVVFRWRVVRIRIS